MRRRLFNTMTLPWSGAPIALADASLSQNLVYDSKNSPPPARRRSPIARSRHPCPLGAAHPQDGPRNSSRCRSEEPGSVLRRPQDAAWCRCSYPRRARRGAAHGEERLEKSGGSGFHRWRGGRSAAVDADAAWRQRLKEEYRALIAYTSVNKSKDNDWFRISAANPEGTRWEGTCWYVPVAYHQVAPEIELPTLDGKIHKTYRGGKICLTGHFKPLWAKNRPRFGLAHAPWLAAEVPILIDSGMVKHKDDEAAQQTPSLRLALLLLLSCLCYHVQMNHVGFRVVQLYIHCNNNGKTLFVQMKFSEAYTYYSSRRLHTPCKPCLSMTYDTEAQ